ncbi:nucleotidyltransferase domain-containing protein [Candidatus Woesearchaeota archaeon]|nr:nucleotidyltransferase domain-containing protein [Candidatus Woesearchaeota archaeon]
MLQNYNKYRILQEFFDFPRKEFGIRAISRITEIAQPSVMNHLKSLVGDLLVVKEKKGLYPTYKANRDNELFKAYKRSDLLVRLCHTGLVDYLYDSCMPDVIILFGSASKGEDIEESDVDLFLICKEKKLDLKKHEEKIRRNINIFFCEDFNILSEELKNNITNGIVLKGYLKVF